MMTAPLKDITGFHEKFAKLVDNVSQVVVGKEAPIRQCATAMVVGGHILLEDNPGTGKTQLARGLANSIDMSFKRISSPRTCCRPTWSASPTQFYSNNY